MMKAEAMKQVTQKKPHVPSTGRDTDPSAVTKPVTRDEQPFDDVHARITVRAYELYIERGRREGSAEQDWLDAEREILSTHRAELASTRPERRAS